MRWQLEVTFQEVRAHLGVETQRQWSDRAIARTTPLLLGMFSWVTLAAAHLDETELVGSTLVSETFAHFLRCHSIASKSLMAHFSYFMHVGFR